jgi:hypothetical protein
MKLIYAVLTLALIVLASVAMKGMAEYLGEEK